MSSEDEEMGRVRGETDGEEGEAEVEGEECPQPEEEKEMLFLIEFLVDTMLLKPENMDIQDMDPCLLQGQSCIVLTFLHYPPMCICEKDIDPCKQTGENYIKYNSGKSLMFALSESQFENPPPINLDVCAYKMLPHGSVPNKLPIGATKICLSELFKQVFEKVDEKPEKLPLSKSIKDKYQLVGKRKKCPTAEVTIYIRLSCLGQNIVTEFQRGGNECEPFLFKSKESKKVYQCMAKDVPDEDAEDICPPLPGWGTSLGKECGDGGGDIGGRVGGGGGKDCAGGGGGGGGAGSGGARSGKSGTDMEENFNTGPEFNDDDEFDEFGTEVHGHALTIKIQKSQKRHGGGEDDQSLGKTKSSMSTKAKGGGPGQVSFQVPKSSSLCSKGKGLNKAAVYNVQTTGDGCCGGAGTTQIVQGIDSPDKDIFVLRIGKKGETGGKGKLELELRTPKPKIERNHDKPRRWDKAIQTDAEEGDGKGKKKKK